METLNLVKGQKLSLEKQDANVVFRFGAGWDVNKGNSDGFDVDLAAYAYDSSNKYLGTLFFNNKELLGMKLSEDNRTGAGDGEDEFFKFDTSKIDAKADKVFVVANVYGAKERKQNFGMINNCYIQVTNENVDKNKPVAKLDLSEDFSAFTGVVLGKVYRHGEEWKFQAVGQGVNGNLTEIEKEVEKLL